MSQGPEVALQGTIQALEDPDLHRRSEMLRPDRALRRRPTDEPAHLRGLCRDPAGSDAVERRCRHPRQPRRPQEPEGRAAIKARGAWLLFLPPYSPDLNPIEMAFAKLKANLRARAIRTIDGLWQAIGDICQLYSPTECQNYFNAAGYGLV